MHGREIHTFLFLVFVLLLIKTTLNVGLNTSQEIYIVNWSPKLLPEVLQIRYKIWHHSKCYTPSGLVLHHFTMGLVLYPPIPDTINSKGTKKERKEERHRIPPLHEVMWLAKLLALDGVWQSTSPWICMALSLSPVPFNPPVSSHQGRRTLQHCAGSMQTPSPWQQGRDTGMSS